MEIGRNGAIGVVALLRVDQDLLNDLENVVIPRRNLVATHVWVLTKKSLIVTPGRFAQVRTISSLTSNNDILRYNIQNHDSTGLKTHK